MLNPCSLAVNTSTKPETSPLGQPVSTILVQQAVDREMVRKWVYQLRDTGLLCIVDKANSLVLWPNVDTAGV